MVRMACKRSGWASCFITVLLILDPATGQLNEQQTTETTKPLVKRPEGRRYKTIFASDFGALRGLISASVAIEVEQSIKRYLLEHPELLPADAAIASIDDFDVNLVDFFDCMTGVSMGAAIALFLASRGGQGAAKIFTEDPDIVARYGATPSGSAQAVRIFLREYGPIGYPPAALEAAGGSIFDLSNPSSVGVSMPVYSPEGTEESLGAAFGNSTLADLDTTVLVPALDLISGYAILFVKNAFKTPPTTSSAKLIPRDGPKLDSGNGFLPDLMFDEGKNYYLRDVGLGGGAAPLFNPAHSVSQVNSDEEEFLLVDGVIPIENAALYASHFVISEADLSGFEDIAILSIGTGDVASNYTRVANAGLAGYLEGLVIRSMSQDTGKTSQVSLMDYIFYSNRNTRPYQYLRIQKSVEAESEDAAAVNALDQIPSLDVYEEIGKEMADEYRFAIDIFVRDFIFG